MSRKPIDQQQPSECRQAVWDEIRSNPEAPFTINEMAKLVRLESSTVREYIIGLFNAAYLMKNNAGQYVLSRDSGHEAPRVRKDGSPVTQGQGRRQMWNAMRILKEFSATDIAFNASTDDHRVAESEAKSYCQALCKAGYLVHQSGRASVSGHRYRLLPSMWSGPQPPQIQRTKQIYDPNLKRVIWAKVEGGAE